MNFLPDLFGEPRVAVGKTDTSREAARAIQPSAATIRMRVLADIKHRGAYGATPSEVSAHIKASLLNVRPRTTELKEMGLIADSRRRRKNKNGKNEIVWVAVDATPMEQAA